MRDIKIGIMGKGRAGKDEMAEFLVKHYGLNYKGTTSTAISRKVAKIRGITFEEAHALRHEERFYWRALGDKMRENDHAALAKEVLENSNFLVGVRAQVEIEEVIRLELCDIIYWVDRPSAPFDPTLGFDASFCDVVIQNHWGIPEFHRRIERIAKSFGLLR